MRIWGSMASGACLWLAVMGTPMATSAFAQQPPDEAMSCAELRSAMWRESKGLRQAALLAKEPARRTGRQIMATGGPSREIEGKAQVALNAILAGGFKSKEAKAALKDLGRQANDDLENRHHIPKSQLLQDFGPAAIAGAPSYQRLHELEAVSHRKGCPPRREMR